MSYWKIICRLFQAFWKIRIIFVNVFLKILHWNYNHHYLCYKQTKHNNKNKPLPFWQTSKSKSTQDKLFANALITVRLLNLSKKERGVVQRSCWFMLFLCFRVDQTSLTIKRQPAAGLRVPDNSESAPYFGRFQRTNLNRIGWRSWLIHLLKR